MLLIKKTEIKYYKGKREMHGLFKCDNCGKISEKRVCDGIKLKTCGCWHLKTSTKDWGTPLHKVWSSFKYRCDNNNSDCFKHYGGRGISYCDEWKHFPNFKKWALKNGYKEGLQIDRIDNDGNYCPENCRFVTSTINNRNRPSVKLSMGAARKIRLLYKYKIFTQKELAKKFNVSPTTISEITRNLIWKETK